MRPNPFNPNSVVAPTLFAGRSTQVVEICKKLSQLKLDMPSSFFIHGERGIGKTALAKLIRYIAIANDPDLYSLDLLSSYYCVESGQDIGSVLQESINNLTDGMDKTLVKSIGDKLGNIFNNGKFQIGAFGLSLGIDNQNQREISIKDQAVSILSSIIRSLKNQTQGTARKDGILIIIDEMHNIKNIAETASILRNIITTLDVETLGQISFAIVGYDIDVDNFFSKDSSARRTFDLIPLTTMPSTEAIEVLKKGFDSISVKYDTDALTKNIMAAGGYPHTIQVLGRFLVESDSDDNILQEDWDSALIDAAFSMKTKEFSMMYSFNKPLTIRDTILSLLAKENRPLSKNEIKQILNKNIYQYIPDLKKIGAIKENDEKKIVLQSQLFRTAIVIDEIIRKKKLNSGP